MYPFDEGGGKLYPVNGTYVKASYGGEKIEKGEKKVCYVLEGTNENIALDDDNETVKYIDSKGGSYKFFYRGIVSMEVL